MRIVAVDNFCRLACPYCAGLGMLAPRAHDAVRREGEPPQPDTILACNAAFSEVRYLFKSRAPRGLIHSRMESTELEAALDAFAREGIAPWFLVDSQGFAWRRWAEAAAKRGATAEFVVLVRRSLPANAILREIPADLRVRCLLFFPDFAGDADFYMPDEAVLLLRSLRTQFPDFALRPFTAGGAPFFRAFDESDYFLGFAAHGAYPRLRRLILRAHSGGVVWWIPRLCLNLLALLASFALDPRQARDLAAAANRSAFWKSFHLASEAQGRARYGWAIFCKNVLWRAFHWIAEGLGAVLFGLGIVNKEAVWRALHWVAEVFGAVWYGWGIFSKNVLWRAFHWIAEGLGVVLFGLGIVNKVAVWRVLHWVAEAFGAVWYGWGIISKNVLWRAFHWIAEGAGALWYAWGIVRKEGLWRAFHWIAEGAGALWYAWGIVRKEGLWRLYHWGCEALGLAWCRITLCRVAVTNGAIHLYWACHRGFWAAFYSRYAYPLRKPFYILDYQLMKFGFLSARGR